MNYRGIAFQFNTSGVGKYPFWFWRCVAVPVLAYRIAGRAAFGLNELGLSRGREVE